MTITHDLYGWELSKLIHCLATQEHVYPLCCSVVQGPAPCLAPRTALCAHDWEQFVVAGRDGLNIYIFSWWHSEVVRIWTKSNTQRLVSCHEWKRTQSWQELEFRTVKWCREEVRRKWESLETEHHILHFIFLCIFVLPILYEGKYLTPISLLVWNLGLCMCVFLRVLAFEYCASNTMKAAGAKGLPPRPKIRRHSKWLIIIYNITCYEYK